MNRTHYWDYYSLFQKYKNDCSIFVETGTHLGESVEDALDLGFEKIISVELDDEYYNQCVNKFKDNPKITLLHGNSVELMPSMLNSVDKKSLIFLDAHGVDSMPIWMELALIGTHPIKNHTIIIDDMHTWFVNDAEKIKYALLKINPNYTIVIESQVKNNFTNEESGAKAHCVAYIP
jgi:hypothetical protein